VWWVTCCHWSSRIAANQTARELVQKLPKELMPNPPAVIMGKMLSHAGK
jgi:hypothetical protein